MVGLERERMVGENESEGIEAIPTRTDKDASESDSGFPDTVKPANCGRGLVIPIAGAATMPVRQAPSI